MNHTSGLSYGFDATGALNPVDGIYFKNKRGIHGSGDTLEQMVDGLDGEANVDVCERAHRGLRRLLEEGSYTHVRQHG